MYLNQKVYIDNQDGTFLQQKSYGLTGATESFYTKDETISYTLSNQN